MSEQIPQREALKMQLAMIAGSSPSTSYFEIRSKRAVGMAQDFIPCRELDRAARAIRNRSELADVFVGAAPRTERKGTAEAIKAVHCLWVDCDNAEAVELLRKFSPLPNFVVWSGGKDSLHAYWQLMTPVPPQWAQRGNRRLALATGADLKATDPARILRPCGTFNHKYGDRRPVVCTRCELDVFTFAQVVGHLADDRPYVPASRPREIRSVSPSKVLDGLAKFVSQAAPDSKNRNSSLFWAACRLRERVDDCQIDETVGRRALLDAALATGLSETEIERTLDSALGRARAAA